MKSAVAAVALAAMPIAAFAQNPSPPAAVEPAAAEKGRYTSDPGHAYITFTYLHQGYSRPYLRWRTWTGTLDWDPANPEASSIEAVIQAASIDSGVDRFDDHLKSADFFDVEAHPQITFRSTSLETTGPAAGRMTGDLTIKGVTKPVTLDVTLNRAADDSFAKGYKLGFSARGVVKRSDFGVDKYVPFVGDEVDVIIEAEFVKPKAETK